MYFKLMKIDTGITEILQVSFVKFIFSKRESFWNVMSREKINIHFYGKIF